MTRNQVAGGHDIQPVVGSWRTLSGEPGDILKPRDYPLEALCMRCGNPIRLDSFWDRDWRHIERFSLGTGEEQ